MAATLQDVPAGMITLGMALVGVLACPTQAVVTTTMHPVTTAVQQLTIMLTASKEALWAAGGAPERVVAWALGAVAILS